MDASIPRRGASGGGGRFGVALLIGLGLLVRTAPAQILAVPDAEEVMRKSIDAIGGEKAIEQLKTRVVRGRVEIAPAGGEGHFEACFRAPNRYYVEIQRPDLGEVQAGCSGGVCWEQTRRGARLLEGDEKADAARDARLRRPIEWQKLHEKVECTGRQMIYGQSCFKVEFTPKEGSPEVVYYEANSYLPLRCDRTREINGRKVTTETTYRDYEMVDGIRLPHTVSVKTQGEPRVEIYKIEKARHNVPVPKKRFRLPVKVQKLVDEDDEADELDNDDEDQDDPPADGDDGAGGRIRP